jgi:hypothetical protein
MIQVNVPLLCVQVRYLLLQVRVGYNDCPPALTVSTRRRETGVVKDPMQDGIVKWIVGEIPTRWVGAHCLIEIHALTLRGWVVAA